MHKNRVPSPTSITYKYKIKIGDFSENWFSQDNIPKTDKIFVKMSLYNKKKYLRINNKTTYWPRHLNIQNVFHANVFFLHRAVFRIYKSKFLNSNIAQP